MVLKIEKDHQRFRQIVKGRIRDDLRKFLTKGELIGKEGKHLISIPVRDKYSGIKPVGPNSLRHFKRSFKEALKRQIMVGDYDPANPVIIPQKKDMRYRSWKEVKSPQSNAVIVFMMDVSGSMGEEQKE